MYYSNQGWQPVYGSQQQPPPPLIPAAAPPVPVIGAPLAPPPPSMMTQPSAQQMLPPPHHSAYAGAPFWASERGAGVWVCNPQRGPGAEPRWGVRG